MTTEQKTIISQHQKTAPVDITALADALGLSVYVDYKLADNISGMIQKDSLEGNRSGYVISVNANEHYYRRRFTVAHECAHFLRHRHKIGDGVIDDPMYRSPNMNTKEEFEANNTAADLLMPRHLVAEQVRRGSNDIIQLAWHFQVSEAAMRVRMRYLSDFLT